MNWLLRALLSSACEPKFRLFKVYGTDKGALISSNSWAYTAINVYETSVLTAIDYAVAAVCIAEYSRDI